MKKPDGSVCNSTEENADVFKTHFEELFGQLSEVDASVLDLLEQLPVRQGLDHLPTDEEFEKLLHSYGIPLQETRGSVHKRTSV